MQFCNDGPDIPHSLISAQERGEVIFVIGAGVSVAAGLPLFRGLVEGIYDRLKERWDLHPAERDGMEIGGKLEGQYDRVLRCLERRLIGSNPTRQTAMRARMRLAIDQILAAPPEADLSNHLALLELSRDSEGRRRLLTTNFDTLFERAWFQKAGEPIPTHAGMAMPQPKSANFTGVLHLHGSLSDPDKELNATATDLVLTSAEFGDAYLRLGWASRYVYDLVRTHTVVLVGYQADDPPMRYLLEALEADRERYSDLHQVYAFAPCKRGDENGTRAIWQAKGIEPIAYWTDDTHSFLYATLKEWRTYAEHPSRWRREQLRPILTKTPESCSELELDRALELLRHGDAREQLNAILPEPHWLKIFVERRLFKFGSETLLPAAWIGSRLNEPR